MWRKQPQGLLRVADPTKEGRGFFALDKHHVPPDTGHSRSIGPGLPQPPVSHKLSVTYW